MLRADAVRIVMEAVTDELVVVCNGMIGREAFTANDREANFYMIGSMGLASSIGLGIALCKPEKRILVLDGDGNVLMGAGALASVAAAAPKNLLHLVFDNESHGSTGGQRTVSNKVALEAMAKGAGYRSAERVDAAAFAARLPAFLASEGPALLLVKVEPGNVKGIARVSHTPPEIARRFAQQVRS